MVGEEAIHCVILSVRRMPTQPDSWVTSGVGPGKVQPQDEMAGGRRSTGRQEASDPRGVQWLGSSGLPQRLPSGK